MEFGELYFLGDRGGSFTILSVSKLYRVEQWVDWGKMKWKTQFGLNQVYVHIWVRLPGMDEEDY
jgi:hypothetical protein